MSPKTLTLLNEKHIYVSWGILILVITLTLIAAKIMFQLDQLMPLIPWKAQIDKDISLIKYQLQINKLTNE